MRELNTRIFLMKKYIMILKKSFACEALFVYHIGSYFIISYTAKFYEIVYRNIFRDVELGCCARIFNNF